MLALRFVGPLENTIAPIMAPAPALPLTRPQWLHNQVLLPLDIAITTTQAQDAFMPLTETLFLEECSTISLAFGAAVEVAHAQCHIQ